MRTVRIEDADGRVLCERCLVAERALPRMKGLLGRSDLPRGEGMLFRPAGSIHMFFMRFPIDVVFLDRELRVVAITPELKPWRTAAKRGAKAVIELAAGEAGRRGLELGAQLRLVDVPG